MQQEREDRCYDSQDRYSPKDELSACDELLARNGNTKEEQADILAARGAAYHRLGNHEKALADYDQAIALDPRDSHSLYNRGLIYEELDDPGSALFAYAESLEIEPNNADAYLNKGTILLDRAKLDEAVVDFTRAHELEPSDPWALASRGITYAWKRDRARAERDFEAVERMAPYNPVLVRGRALLSMHAGEFRAAVDQLTVALLLDREDMWSLNMRAEAYRQLGEQEEAQADIERLRQLRSETG
jgi:tetratricopeptide (TPR) repeat protein